MTFFHLLFLLGKKQTQESIGKFSSSCSLLFRLKFQRDFVTLFPAHLVSILWTVLSIQALFSLAATACACVLCSDWRFVTQHTRGRAFCGVLQRKSNSVSLRLSDAGTVDARVLISRLHERKWTSVTSFWLTLSIRELIGCEAEPVS